MCITDDMSVVSALLICYHVVILIDAFILLICRNKYSSTVNRWNECWSKDHVFTKKKNVKEYEFKTVIFNTDSSKDKYVNVACI